MICNPAKTQHYHLGLYCLSKYKFMGLSYTKDWGKGFQRRRRRIPDYVMHSPAKAYVGIFDRCFPSNMTSFDKWNSFIYEWFSRSTRKVVYRSQFAFKQIVFWVYKTTASKAPFTCTKFIPVSDFLHGANIHT